MADHQAYVTSNADLNCWMLSARDQLNKIQEIEGQGTSLEQRTELLKVRFYVLPSVKLFYILHDILVLRRLNPGFGF